MLFWGWIGLQVIMVGSWRNKIMVSRLKANKMLAKKCEGLLAYIVIDSNGEVSLENI